MIIKTEQSLHPDVNITLEVSWHWKPFLNVRQPKPRILDNAITSFPTCRAKLPACKVQVENSDTTYIHARTILEVELMSSNMHSDLPVHGESPPRID